MRMFSILAKAEPRWPRNYCVILHGHVGAQCEMSAGSRSIVPLNESGGAHPTLRQILPAQFKTI